MTDFHSAGLGTFSIEPRESPLGVAYVSRWVAPDGRVMTQARPPANPTSSGAAYCNDPSVGPGLGAFAAFVAFGKPPPKWRYWDSAWTDEQPANTSWTTGFRRIGFPGVAWTSDPIITSDSYEQGVALLHGALQVRVRWTFERERVRFEASAGFEKVATQKLLELDPFVKEPLFAFGLTEGAGITAASFPGTECRRYRKLFDPTKATGRCEDPKRKTIVFEGPFPIRLRVDDLDWRKLGVEATRWRKAGDNPCPGVTGRRIHSNWELPAWGPPEKRDNPSLAWSSCVAAVKAWEGCVDGLNFSHGFRRPRTTRAFRLAVTIAPA